MHTAKARGTPPTLKERIYYQMMESIMKGEILPEEIINEKNLVEQFGVSKSPIREALIQLCNEGVLRSIPRYGYEVVRLTDADLARIRDWRLIVECGYMKERWHLVTPQKVHRLAELRAREMEESGDVQSIFEHWQRNSRFHLELISFYENPYATEQLSKALRILTRAYAQFYWEKWHNTILRSTSEHHRLLVEALKAADCAESLRLLSDDIQTFHMYDTTGVIGNDLPS